MVKKFNNSGNETRKYAVYSRLHWFKVKLDPRLNWTEVWTRPDGARART